MTNPLRWPLHYQILAAMVVGAAVGLAVNPGEQELPDARITVAKTDGKLRVTGPEKYTEHFDDFSALKKRFPELADEFKASGKDAVTIDVTHRRVHLSEDGKKITLRYVRLHDGKKAVSSYDAATLDKLVAENPEWEPQRKAAIDWYADLTARHISVWSKFIGDLFLRLLRMITVPLIVTSLVTGVAGLGSTSRLGSMFGKTMLYYAVTSMLAIFTGIAMVNLVRPGIGVSLPFGGKAVAAGQNQSLATIFTNLINSMIPPNPVQALAEGEFLSIITFSILVGVFIIKVGGKSGETLSGFFQAGFDVMMDMTQAVIRLAPIGVLAFMLFATCTQGIEVFKTFAWYMVTVALALLFHAVVTLPLIVWFVAKRSPWEYAKAMTPALLTAFSTASSNGTLPLTMTSVEERAGVSNRVSSFVLPLGATVNMDGTALYEAVAVLFIAQATPGFAMTLESQIIVAVTALLASVGAAGIPSAGLVMMAIVLQAVGLPLEAVGLIIAVDRVLDMARTSVNVWSDSCGCAVLNRFEPETNSIPPEVAAS
jgi:Na+/H+-dicarboxylate symporter